MKITEFVSSADGMFVFIHLENGYVIRMTPRCLHDLGWFIGDLISQ